MSVALLVSNDRELAATVQSAIEPIPHCQLRLIAGTENLEAGLRDESVCLAIIHVPANAEGSSLDAAMKRSVRTCQRELPPSLFGTSTTEKRTCAIFAWGSANVSQGRLICAGLAT